MKYIEPGKSSTDSPSRFKKPVPSNTHTIKGESTINVAVESTYPETCRRQQLNSLYYVLYSYNKY